MKQNMKLTKKKNRKLIMNQEANSILVVDVNKNEVFEIIKLNSMYMIVFLEEHKKKLMSERHSILKKCKDLQDSKFEIGK